MGKERHQHLGLSDQDVLNMYYYMLLARKLDERSYLLNRAGKIPFVVSCQGQEAAQVGAAYALDRSKDYIFPYYRDLALILAWGMTAQEVLLHNFAKGEDPNSGGRQMPGHYGAKKYRMVTASSPVTTQVPQAAGIALAAKMKGQDFVTFVTFGEGSSNQGDFHEGLNFAGVHKLPVIFFCQNNKYAISVPLEKQLACASIADRGIGYGMPGVSVDGNDPLAVYAVVKEAVERARRGEGPTLIEAVVDRLMAHSSDDNDRTYRSQEEIQEAWDRDPLIQFRDYLLVNNILTSSRLESYEQEIAQKLDEATTYADQASYAEPESALRYVYAE